MPSAPESCTGTDDGWTAARLLRSLQDAAPAQLSTSGSGNHFVERGSFELAERDDPADGLGCFLPKIVPMADEAGNV